MAQPVRPPVLYGVDSGGSRTVVTVVRDGAAPQQWEHESFAIATAGPERAVQVLAELLAEIVAAVDGHWAVGCIGSSAMPVGDEAPPPMALLDAIRTGAPRGVAVLVNDVLPLLWSPHLSGLGLAVSSGTGSSVIGRGAGDQLLKVGGHEYIISDEGSAYSLAREGLRCAARAADGIGEATSLRDAAEAFFDRPMSAIGRWLAELPRARRTVASFAPVVTDAGARGDRVASRVVAAEAERLVDSVELAAHRLMLPDLSAIGLAGGVFAGSPFFRGRVERLLEQRGLTDVARSNVALLDGLDAALGFARLTAGQLPKAPAGLLMNLHRAR